jgi:hypothetical protein
MSIGGLLDDIADSWKAIIAANPKKQVQKTLGAGFQQGMGFTELATRDVRKLMQIDQQKNRNRKQTGRAGVKGATFQPNLATFEYGRPQLPSMTAGSGARQFTFGQPRFGMSYASPNDFFSTSGQTQSGTYDTTDRGNFTGSGDPSGARGLDGTKQWQTMIERAANEAGIPWQVIAAIMGIESGGNNPGVVNPHSGATGLMQIMPNIWGETAAKYGGNLKDPWTNIRTAADILKYNYDQYGDWGTAANAYLGFGPSDAHGTTGEMYVNLFNNNLAALGYGGGGGGGGGTGKPTFPVAGYEGAVDLHWGEDPGAADIFADYGTPVLAINGGTASSGYSEIGGYWTYITGDDGLVYYYAHMDGMGPNGRVEAGQHLAGVSDTGNAKGTGPHLHLGIATAGHGINSGAGPQGGAGDINVAQFLAGTWRGGTGTPGYTAPVGGGNTSGSQTRSERYGYNF